MRKGNGKPRILARDGLRVRYSQHLLVVPGVALLAPDAIQVVTWLHPFRAIGVDLPSPEVSRTIGHTRGFLGSCVSSQIRVLTQDTTCVSPLNHNVLSLSKVKFAWLPPAQSGIFSSLLVAGRRRGVAPLFYASRP